MNLFQKQVLENFPKGLASAGELLYESRDFPDSMAEVIAAGPPYPVDVYNLGDKEGDGGSSSAKTGTDN